MKIQHDKLRKSYSPGGVGVGGLGLGVGVGFLLSLRNGQSHSKGVEIRTRGYLFQIPTISRVGILFHRLIEWRICSEFGFPT